MKQIIFDLEIFLEDGKYRHQYNVNTPDEGALFHLLFINHLLEKIRQEIIETDIGGKESEWENVSS